MKKFQVDQSYIKLSLFVLAITVSTVFNYAQAFAYQATSTISISGKVMDQSGAMINGATVFITDISGEQVGTVKTDVLGTYKISNLAPGRYRLFVNYTGYSTLSRVAIVESKLNDIVQDFSLSLSIIEEQITVTASKGNATVSVDVPQPVEVKNINEIETQRPTSTLDSINQTPNLTSISSNPFLERPRLRGLASNRLLILIDGERLNNFRSDPLSGLSPSIINPFDLQSAEIINGGGSSLYGTDALGGTINFITQSPYISKSIYLGIKFNGDFHTNDDYRRGGTVINFSTPNFALRLSSSLFRLSNYSSGNSNITIGDVVRLGNLAVDMGNAIGNNVARTYGVFNLPSNAEIPNGQGHGSNQQIDAYFFPNSKHNFRYRQINSLHKDLGFPFSTPPFDSRNQFNGFRRYDKYSGRYELHQAKQWLPNLSLSYYRQKYSFADDNIVSGINLGSSFDLISDPTSPTGVTPLLTGKQSTFSDGLFTDGKNSVTSQGFEAQTTFVPYRKVAITMGIAKLRDFSRDDFSRVDLSIPINQPGRVTNAKASTPDTIYNNLGYFSFFALEPFNWIRLTGGIRVDNLDTKAKVTPNFPLGIETAVINASIDQLVSNPGQINIIGLMGIRDLLKGTSNIHTNNTTITGNGGIVVRLSNHINPYLRLSSSYREPGITERYILRDFGDPTFSVLLSPNTKLKPERGNGLELGVKINYDRISGYINFFQTNYRDFLKPAFGNVLFVPADSAQGLDPISPDFPFHGVLYVQRSNTSRARIKGVEGSYSLILPFGRLGTFTPSTSIGWLKGSDLTPDDNTLLLIRKFYNRSDTPIKLQGSEKDVPLSGITPFRAVFGFTYTNFNSRLIAEYQARYQTRVKRADPIELSSTISTQYGTLASLNSFTVHSIRLGYAYHREQLRILFSVGVNNINNRHYFEHFQAAPAIGRSVTFGTTIDLMNLLK